MGEMTTLLFRDGQVADPVTLGDGVPPSGRSEFVWVELLDPAASDLTALQERFHLHGLAVQDAMSPTHVSKIDIYGDQVFVVMRAARLEGDEIKYAALTAFVGRHHIITVRHREDAGYTQARNKLQRGPETTWLGPDFILHALMDFVVSSYFPVVQMIEDEVLSMEQMFLDEFLGRDEVTRLFRLRREALHLQRVLSRMADVCGKLTHLAVPCIGTESQPYFRDVRDHLVRLDGMTRGLIDVIRAVFEASNLLEQQRQGAITRLLTAWAAILGVPTVIAGIYGMSSPHLTGMHAQAVYLCAVVAMLLACVVLYLRFRKLRWL